MRILTICIAGLALMTAGCASRPATSPAPSSSGAAAAPTTSGMAGDSIDHWAAAVEKQVGMKR